MSTILILWFITVELWKIWCFNRNNFIISRGDGQRMIFLSPKKKKNDKHTSMPQLTAAMIVGIVLLSVNIIQVF